MRAQKEEAAAAVWVPVGELRQWAENPRRNELAVAEVAKSIRRFGWGAPIVANRRDGEIIAGHTRWLAAKRLGMDKVPVRWLDLDPADAHALALADNRTGEVAEWDDARLADVLQQLAQADASLLADTAFSPDDLRRLGFGVEAPADDPFGRLSNAPPTMRVISFTLTVQQAEVVLAACKHAKSVGEFNGTGNENSNGNALARICGGYIA